MSLHSDRELIRMLGLTEQQVASLLHKSRQTLNVGLQRTENYLRSDELGRLLAYCEANLPAQLTFVEEYVRASRDSVEASDALQMAELFAAKNRFLSGDAILASTEAWITLPDFRYFKRTYADSLTLIAERARLQPHTFKLIVSVERDADYFFEYARMDQAAARAATVVASEVDAWPYTLLVDPRSDRSSGWVRLAGGFHVLDGMRTEGMLTVLGRYIQAENVEERSTGNGTVRRRS